MKLHLVAPSRSKARYLFGKETFPPLGFMSLAAYTPRDIEVRVINENVERIDFSDIPDLVGITTMTATAARAYEIAARYRTLGVPVVLGGIHASMLPEEALEHADSVVVGEAETVWPGLLADADAGRLEPVYRSEGFIDFKRPRIPRRDVLDLSRYWFPNTVQTARGCPHDCSFCSVKLFSGRRIRCRDVENVLAEVESLPKSPLLRKKLVAFVDDNIGAKPSRAKELFKALIPMNIVWGSQACITFANDEELVALAAESGCRALLIGLETLSPEALVEVNKRQNKVEEYENALRTLKQHGILVIGTFILGLDSDDELVFSKTLDFAERNELMLAQFGILSLYPGTRLHQRLLDEKRVEPTFWSTPFWENRPVFEPKRMSWETLCEGTYQMGQSFYSYRSIFKRLSFRQHLSHQLVANLIYRQSIAANRPKL
ncbi:B12-binding domain-containing radical SAM protein [Chloroflexota bacterium]